MAEGNLPVPLSQSPQVGLRPGGETEVLERPEGAYTEPEAQADTGEARDDERSSWGRAFARWSQALVGIASAAGLSFERAAIADLPDDQADKLRGEIKEILEAKGGEVLARAQAANIASTYLALSDEGQKRFFLMLAHEFGIARDEVEAAVTALHAAADETARLDAERKLRATLFSPAMRLLTKLNALPEGLRFLIDLRTALIRIRKEDPALRALDADFGHLLATWFDIGFLVRDRLTWDSPASLLEKIIEYEAVHEVRSWRDLRHRLDGDRRLYAFFHRSLPKVPLIFVQVALVEGLAGEIGPLLDETTPNLEPEKADTAIFYSITNTQPGLRGISFGNFLIKQVVDDLARDLPGLRTFATLSPLPGFARWLAGQATEDLTTEDERKGLASLKCDGVQMALERPAWFAEAPLVRTLEAPLRRAAARYLVSRGGDGQPLDPVARFHLGNGARIERLNLSADHSPERLRQSHGLMVNYLYAPGEIEANHEAFARDGVITVSPAVADHLGRGRREAGVKVSRRGGLGRIVRRS